MTEKQLAKHRSRLVRKNARNQELDYLNRSDDGTDDKESARDFLRSIEDFTSRKADEAAVLRKKMGLPEGLQENQGNQSHTESQSKPLRQACWCLY